MSLENTCDRTDFGVVYESLIKPAVIAVWLEPLRRGGA